MCAFMPTRFIWRFGGQVVSFLSVADSPVQPHALCDVKLASLPLRVHWCVWHRADPCKGRSSILSEDAPQGSSVIALQWPPADRMAWYSAQLTSRITEAQRSASCATSTLCIHLLLACPACPGTSGKGAPRMLPPALPGAPVRFLHPMGGDCAHGACGWVARGVLRHRAPPARVGAPWLLLPSEGAVV